MLPGFGRQQHNDWGLGFEIRDSKAPHWTGSRNSPRTFGHFGQSGSFLWVDPDAGLACVALADRDFGDWARQAWPKLSDDLLAAHGGIVIGPMEKPRIVSAEEWQQARDELLKAEKDATRSLDAIAARRRRLPMVKFRTDYEFASPFGPKTLLDLFEGRPQLAAYQFMDNGPDALLPRLHPLHPERHRPGRAGRGAGSAG